MLKETIQPFFSDFARFYSPRIIQELARMGRSAFVDSVLDASGALDLFPAERTYADVFEDVYSMLAESYRCEYIFKNTLLHRRLLDRHALSEAAMVFELRIGGRIADAVVFNGTSTVYEIKTSLDNFDRLDEQLSLFTCAFDRVYVVTENTMLEQTLERLPDTVGLILMDEDRALHECIPSASHIDHFRPELAFNTFRKSEYTSAIREHYGEVPNVPTWQLFDECKELYCKLDADKAHSIFHSVFRARTETEAKQAAIRGAPASLAATVLHTRMSAKSWNALMSSLASTVGSA